MPTRQKMMITRPAMIGPTLTILLTCANANNARRGSVEKIVGGKTVHIKAGWTCFSPTFAARLRRGFFKNDILRRGDGLPLPVRPR